MKNIKDLTIVTIVKGNARPFSIQYPSAMTIHETARMPSAQVKEKVLWPLDRGMTLSRPGVDFFGVAGSRMAGKGGGTGYSGIGSSFFICSGERLK